ncbi:MAG: GH92 family glycosyl hydrolase [Saprospiraceae bacterium]|nr:GH92 family glycosyl hydrolase [Saprospiraceae bacterium]
MKSTSLIVLICLANILFAQTNNTQFVNPFIGTGGHGHTFPGATVPFGMVQLSPDTRTEGWDGASGYHFDDSTVLGFSHTHLNGTGISDFCDVLLTPSVSGSFKPLRFSHKDETAKTGYYKTIVYDELGNRIDVELTSSNRAGFHHYTFPKNIKKVTFAVTLNKRNRNIGRIKKVDNQSIEGNLITTAWAKNRHLSFGLTANAPFEYSEKKLDDARYLTFNVSKTHELLIKVALSPVSEANAFTNLKTEIPHWNFEKTRREAEQKWANYLNRIQIEGTQEQKTIFYTALYHTMIHPSVWQDANGDYRGLDGKIYNSRKFAYHSIFSLWDTYRGANPLYTIVCPEKVSDFVNSFIDDFEKTGHLPMWNFPSSETWCMIGNHAIPVIADAYLKGIKGFDAEKALNAMIATVNRDTFGLKAYRTKGYVPADTEGEAVSKTLEYAYDDYCIAQMALAMGKKDVYDTFIRRSQNWKNLFNPKTGFFQAKMNESFVEPFEPREVNFHFTEGNAWQYAFAVQHDIEGLMTMLGGKEAFEAKLDAFFNADSKTTGRDQADITGLIGQYAHGNEPSHHIAYLYNYVGKPQKTQQIIHKILTEFYKNAPDGLIGNEDCGQMSAWYVLSSMGFYPVNPCGGEYLTGFALYKNPKIKAMGKSELSFNFTNNTTGKTRLKVSTLESDFGVEVLDSVKTPVSNPNLAIIPIPFTTKGTRLFKEKQNIELLCYDKNAEIYYTTDGSDPIISGVKYTQPIEVNETKTIKFEARRMVGNQMQHSKVAEAVFKKKNQKRSIVLTNPPAPQYSAGANDVLIDGEYGITHWQLGGWQGFEGVDLEAIVDLKEETTFNHLILNCVEDQNAWIFSPAEVQFYTSNDGQNFTLISSQKPIIKDTDGSHIRRLGADIKGKARYIKVVAKPVNPIPTWHKGAGGKGWIFADEIIVE